MVRFTRPNRPGRTLHTQRSCADVPASVSVLSIEKCSQTRVLCVCAQEKTDKAHTYYGRDLFFFNNQRSEQKRVLLVQHDERDTADSNGVRTRPRTQKRSVRGRHTAKLSPPRLWKKKVRIGYPNRNGRPFLFSFNFFLPKSPTHFFFYSVCRASRLN